MKKSEIDFTGARIGCITVTGKAVRRYYWVAQCDCGRVVEKFAYSFMYRPPVWCSKTCGLRLVNSVPTKSKVFKAWEAAWRRCSDSRNPSYARYGQRGIRVCDRWKVFENFYSDMGEPPHKKMSLDRINNDGDYEPSNCRWATITQQNRNMSKHAYFIFEGAKRAVWEWAELTGQPASTIYSRLRKGWVGADVLYGRSYNKIKLEHDDYFVRTGETRRTTKAKDAIVPILPIGLWFTRKDIVLSSGRDRETVREVLGRLVELGELLCERRRTGRSLEIHYLKSECPHNGRSK